MALEKCHQIKSYHVSTPQRALDELREATDFLGFLPAGNSILIDTRLLPIL